MDEMLPAWLIEELERERLIERPRPQLEIPIPMPFPLKKPIEKVDIIQIQL